MVIINIDPWEKKDETKEFEAPEESPVLFGFQDLASDYFQVLRQSSRPRIFKIIWGVIVTWLLICTVYMVYKLVSDFFQYNSYNKLSTEWKDNVTLPAISICSTNPINYTALTAALSANDSTEYLITQFDDALDQLENFKGGGYIWDSIDLEQFMNLIYWEIAKGSFITTFKNDISAMPVGSYHYLFENTGQVIENFETVSFPTELGTCLEINDDGGLVQSFNGVKGGFTIDLDAHIQDYLPQTATNGFVVFIRDQDETVMMHRGGYVIAPGTETFMRLTKKSVTRLGEPHGTCENVESTYTKYNDGHFETVRECIQTQMIYFMVLACKCLPWYPAVRAYTLNSTELLDEGFAYLEWYYANLEYGSRKRRGLDLENTIRRSHRDTDEGTQQSIYTTKYGPYMCRFIAQVGCQSALDDYIQKGDATLEDCPEPCGYNEWNVEMSSTVFPPTSRYYERFMQNETGNATFEYARENIARIHIYYDDLKIEKIDQEKAYEVQNFIAEFGGTVDLFIGFSFFTVLQLVEIVVAGCITRCYRKKENRDASTPTKNDLALVIATASNTN